jgi:hypothetical protein
MVCELTSPIYSLVQGICPVLRLHPPRLFVKGDSLREAVHESPARCKLRAQGFEDFPYVQHFGIDFHQRRLDLGLHNRGHVVY